MAAQPAGFVPDGFVPDTPSTAADLPASVDGSPGTRFAENLWSAVNPLHLVTAVQHPVETLGALVDAHVQEAIKTKAMYDAGRYSEAVGHLGATLLPVLGPAAAHAGEQIGSGDIAGGLGSAVGVIASTQTPKVVGRVGTAAVRTAGGALRGVTSGGALGDVVGAVSPRAYHAVRILEAIRQGLGRAAEEPPAPIEPPPTPPRGGGGGGGSHLDRSVPVRPSELTPDQLAERMQFGTGTPPPRGSRTPVFAPRPSAASVEPPAPIDRPPSTVHPPVSPAAEAPASSPGSASAGFGWSPQQIQNELGLAARRMRVTLTEPQYREAADLVRSGRTPTAAVADVSARPTGASPTASTSMLNYSAAERKVYSELRRQGRSHAEASDAIDAQREFLRRFGMPTS